MNRIEVNARATDVPPGWSVADLVFDLGYAGKRVAVERNGQIVARGAHDQTLLEDGDRLEIVIAVGGG
jgi:sulfur carrier protein